MSVTLQQDVIERACHALREVAEGRQLPALYFWTVTHALEAVRDGDAIEANFLWKSLCEDFTNVVVPEKAIPSSITDPVDDGSCDPLRGKRMDSADRGEN